MLRSWSTGERGVGAFDAWCVERSWPMVRVPTERDVGIDGFVQVTDGERRPTGEVFAVQVRSGPTYKRATDYVVPVERHGRMWRDASVPVIAVVHDTADGSLWWSNATEVLRASPDVTNIAVRTRLPDPSADPMPLLRSVRLSADFRGGLPRGLGSDSVEDQLQAVWQSFALGFRDANALVAVRRVIASLFEETAHAAVNALSYCIYHPDNFLTPGNLLPPQVRAQVAASFRWRQTEVLFLLRLIDDENGIDRGSIGQTVYLLIFEDPEHVQKLSEVAEYAAAFDLDLAGWAAYLAVAGADEQDQLDLWRSLLTRQPLLRGTFVSDTIGRSLSTVGFLSLE